MSNSKVAATQLNPESYLKGLTNKYPVLKRTVEISNDIKDEINKWIDKINYYKSQIEIPKLRAKSKVDFYVYCKSISIAQINKQFNVYKKFLTDVSSYHGVKKSRKDFQLYWIHYMVEEEVRFNRAVKMIEEYKKANEKELLQEMYKTYGDLVGDSVMSLTDSLFHMKIKSFKDVDGVEQIKQKEIPKPNEISIKGDIANKVFYGDSTTIVSTGLTNEIVESIMTKFDNNESIVENVSFSELRTSIGRSYKTYIYTPQIEGYLRYNFMNCVSVLRDNEFAILKHIVNGNKDIYKFNISKCFIYYRY